jgi:hypothetical protein
LRDSANGGSRCEVSHVAEKRPESSTASKVQATSDLTSSRRDNSVDDGIAFAINSSFAIWQLLMRFTPPDLCYDVFAPCHRERPQRKTDW